MMLATTVALWLGGVGSAAAANEPWAQGVSRPEDLVVSLATFSPGDPIPQWFGHTALVVEDRRLNVARLYNYGMFSFDQGMLRRFAMGRLEFWVAAAPVAPTYQFYIQEDRDVRVIELNLPPEKRAEMAAFLADNVRPENRDYLYHHYDDNCATRVRDIIDQAVGGQFKEAFDRADPLTLRGHTRRHSQHMMPMDWLLMFLMNGDIDREIAAWDAMFLPEVLEEAVLDFSWVDAQGNEQPLVLRTHQVHRSSREPVPQVPPTHWPIWLVVGVVLGAGGLVWGRAYGRRATRVRRVMWGAHLAGMGLLMGGLGTGLFVMASFTDHEVTFWNLNVLLANPLTLWAGGQGVRVMLGSADAARRALTTWKVLLGLASLALGLQVLGLVVPAIYQDMSIPLGLLFPWILLNTLGVILATKGAREGAPAA
ncbi:hypothetical protein DL240_15980 [Lujinxingia litoralis]|uniref:Lnb N-terminal periplasmic domain-containing protein n=2 Tax=Lujinxingia litoralis TaxID=2211119 RepID=A0A328C471_9DELT|nr:hypothetical protein DL240_15980 [Lujinxingia litoralis]